MIKTFFVLKQWYIPVLMYLYYRCKICSSSVLKRLYFNCWYALFQVLFKPSKKIVFLSMCAKPVLDTLGYTCVQNLSSEQGVLGARGFITSVLDWTSVLGDQVFSPKPLGKTPTKTLENPCTEQGLKEDEFWGHWWSKYVEVVNLAKGQGFTQVRPPLIEVKTYFLLRLYCFGLDLDYKVPTPPT